MGIAPPQPQAFFPRTGATAEPYWRQRVLHWHPLHTKQLGTHASFTSTQVFQRSVFGLAHCYNVLPQTVVDLTTVKSFQKHLQLALLNFAEGGTDDSQELYSGSWKRFPRTKLDTLFGLSDFSRAGCL